MKKLSFIFAAALSVAAGSAEARFHSSPACNAAQGVQAHLSDAAQRNIQVMDRVNEVATTVCAKQFADATDAQAVVSLKDVVPATEGAALSYIKRFETTDMSGRAFVAQ